MATYGYQDYKTTSYGAQGGADGGGFMAGGASQAGSQETPSKSYTKDSLRPVTIKQLIDADHAHPDSDFKIDGADVTQITFIGQVRTVSIQATNITYRLDDGTGLIDTKKWVDQDKIDADGGQPGAGAFDDGQYVRVFGRLKEFSGKRHVGAHAIRAITDHNEIAFHLLQAAFVHLYFTRGPIEAPGKDGGGGGGAGGMFVDHGAAAAAPRPHVPGAPAAAVGGAFANRAMSSTARRVLTELHERPQGNEGLHIRQLSTSLSLPATEVFKACDDLLSMGIIYTTMDDETFAVLEC